MIFLYKRYVHAYVVDSLRFMWNHRRIFFTLGLAMILVGAAEIGPGMRYGMKLEETRNLEAGFDASACVSSRTELAREKCLARRAAMHQFEASQKAQAKALRAEQKARNKPALKQYEHSLRTNKDLSPNQIKSMTRSYELQQRTVDKAETTNLRVQQKAARKTYEENLKAFLRRLFG